MNLVRLSDLYLPRLVFEETLRALEEYLLSKP